MAPRRSATDRLPAAEPTTRAIGERFATALAAKDAVGLTSLLAADVDFRALTPFRAWEADEPEAIVDTVMLGTWFDSTRRITRHVATDSDAIGPVGHVAYRFEVEQAGDDFVVEQQAYFRTDGDVIVWLRILCTGFIPAASVPVVG